MNENINNFNVSDFVGMQWFQNGITSAVAVLVFLILRSVLIHFIKGKKEILDKDQRRWMNRINNTTSILIFVGLVLIWAPQLHTFALSLTAVAVAIVLTTKELLMCLTGGFLRASAKPFEVGDWVTVDSVSGEVMKITATMTLIEKLDMSHGHYDHTGETIQIPNSRFLTANVENLNFIKDYIYHNFMITVPYEDLNPEYIKSELSNITTKYIESFVEAATKFNKKVEKKSGVDFADINPRIHIKTTDIGNYMLLVRVFVPTEKASEIEDDITMSFLQYCHDQRKK